MSDKDLNLDVTKIDLTTDDIYRSLPSVVEKIRNTKYKKNVILLVAGMFPIARIDVHTAVKPEIIFPPAEPDPKLIEKLATNLQDIQILQHINKQTSNYRNPFMCKYDAKSLKTRYTNQQFKQLQNKFSIIKTKRK